MALKLLEEHQERLQVLAPPVMLGHSATEVQVVLTGQGQVEAVGMAVEALLEVGVVVVQAILTSR